jgi:phenylalanyl-tRNA synthetase alpha chain
MQKDEPELMALEYQTGFAVRELLEEARLEVSLASTEDELEQLRTKFLGRNGRITRLARAVGDLPVEQRRQSGQAINEAKRDVEELIKDVATRLAAVPTRTTEAQVDVTLPGIRSQAGHLHPVTLTMERMKEILIGLGFAYDDYPEVETEYYNFDALNTPKWHPARDLHDSFYTTDGRVLRTHTSAFQARAMRKYGEPPIKAITSGRCYRNDDIDASHLPVFHQLDGIAVGRDISFADLKWTLYELMRLLFGEGTRLRFRPSYFPFTTPSAEVDVSCIICKGKGCSLCSNTGWLEVLGSGMMRPEVLRAGNLDPDVYQGFAFGIGVDRMTMLRYQIDDIRRLISNEESFLRQF